MSRWIRCAWCGGFERDAVHVQRRDCRMELERRRPCPDPAAHHPYETTLPPGVKAWPHRDYAWIGYV